MKRRWMISSCLVVSLVAVVFMTGCENGNLFGSLHDTGSGDIESLASDASDALRNKNYSLALSLYEQILTQDSDNAEALYGAAAAALGTSGLSLGQIISNILNQTSGAPSINGLAGVVHSAQNGATSQSIDPDSLLSGIDLASLDAVIDVVICRLQRITSGTADGSILPNDVDTLVNLGVLCALRATLDANLNNLIDITNINGTWGVAQGSAFGSFCGNSANDAALVSMGTDVCASYAYLNQALTILGSSAAGGIISDLTNDLDSIGTQLFTTELPAGCVTTLSNNGITVANFKTFFNTSTPPSGC